jgi:hypothetical protein
MGLHTLDRVASPLEHLKRSKLLSSLLTENE